MLIMGHLRQLAVTKSSDILEGKRLELSIEKCKHLGNQWWELRRRLTHSIDQSLMLSQHSNKATGVSKTRKKNSIVPNFVMKVDLTL